MPGVFCRRIYTTIQRLSRYHFNYSHLFLVTYNKIRSSVALKKGTNSHEPKLVDRIQ